ncbi:MAG: hypothetical protein REH83_01840 [Rickettsiella sp.]|nr:hypothetical protein [Rickettsiella sp.]
MRANFIKSSRFAENSQRHESYITPGELKSSRYFYTKCRDASTLIRNPKEVDFSNPQVMLTLGSCIAYTDASLDWFFLSLAPILGKNTTSCYIKTISKDVPSRDELLSSIISFMNMHEDLLDKENTPSIFTQAVLAKYHPMSVEGSKKEFPFFSKFRYIFDSKN